MAQHVELIMNRYLEKIAKMSSRKVLHVAEELHTIESAYQKKRKKKKLVPSSKASRKYNRGPMRKD